ncbi:MAG: hypothetical protein V1820_01980, partial [archaeon]
MGSSLFTYLVTAVSGILTAKILLPEEYAVKVLVFSIVNLVLAFADLGMPFALIRGAGRLSPAQARDTFVKSIWINAISCGLFYFGGFFFFLKFGKMYGIDSVFLFSCLVLANICRQLSSL